MSEGAATGAIGRWVRSSKWRGRIRLVVSAWLAAIVVPLATGSAVLTSGSASAAPSTDWTAYLNGPSHNSYNPAATSITVPGIEAGNLQPVWRWTPPASPNAGPPAIMATPVVYNGVFYVGVEDGIFYAVNETTQQIVWSDSLGLRTPAPGGGCGNVAQGIYSTATVAPDPSTGVETVYVNSQDGFMYALNAATGAVEWKSQVDNPSSTVDDYFAWSSPTVANGKVYVGLASWCDLPLVSAGVIGFDQSTGAEIGMWNSLPPGGPRGERVGHRWGAPRRRRHRHHRKRLWLVPGPTALQRVDRPPQRLQPGSGRRLADPLLAPGQRR